jgi:hypothetical protein
MAFVVQTCIDNDWDGCEGCKQGIPSHRDNLASQYYIVEYGVTSGNVDFKLLIEITVFLWMNKLCEYGHPLVLKANQVSPGCLFSHN